MKKTITGAAFTLFAALTSTTVLAAPDEQKLEKQMYDLKQELDDLKKSKIFDLEFGTTNYYSTSRTVVARLFWREYATKVLAMV